MAVFIQRKNFLINLLHINVYVNLFSLFRKKKKDLEKFKLTLFRPKSDKYLISPSSITHESNIKIERLKEMTANYPWLLIIIQILFVTTIGNV